MADTRVLLQKFHKLAEAEQQILLSLAILFSPVGQTRLQEILRALDCVDPRACKLIAKPLREKLLKQGLIEQNQFGWRCATGGISELLMRIALQTQPDLFSRLANFSLSSREYVAQPYQLVDKVRCLRLFLYLGDNERFEQQLREIEDKFYNDVISVFNLLFFSNFDKAWFDSLNSHLKTFVLSRYAHYGVFGLENIGFPLQQLQESIQLGEPSAEASSLALAEYNIILGDTQNIAELIKGDFSVQGLSLKGSLCFIENSNNEALENYAAAIQLIKKQTRKRNVCLPGIHGYFFNLALFKDREPESLSLLRNQLNILAKSKEEDEFENINRRLLEAVNVYQGQVHSLEYTSHIVRAFSRPYDMLFHALILYWLDSIAIATDFDAKFLGTFKKYCLQAEQVGAIFYTAVSATLLEKLGIKDSKIKRLAIKYKHLPCIHLVDLLPQVEKWERALQALTQINAPAMGSGAAGQAKSRMVWILTLDGNDATLEPREQKIGKTGRWTKGRPVALKRLVYERETFDYLTEQDKRICHQIEVEQETNYYGYGRTEYYSLEENGLIAAIGHPHVYWAQAAKYDTPIII
ncbi:MAG: hypothetical protein KAJ63_00745, partial [Methyloprofundus sp.]|nr:hypothetical protein [Methyloprofundus sp.]